MGDWQCQACVSLRLLLYSSWLEDPDSEETTEFMASEADLAESMLSWLGRASNTREREREHRDCHGLNYFAEILEKLNGIILLIGNLGIDFHLKRLIEGRIMDVTQLLEKIL
ncbi:uncharacterized protein [Aegilops tauschii subsp. strangulata]|uniref:uncharacterized protein isoform X2 n=1 Tax=Aegilops tauschii subsp. strangulata TaxID=200361 RepID=UPI003CC8BE92